MFINLYDPESEKGCFAVSGFVSFTSSEGEIGVGKKHTNFIGEVQPGVLSFKEDGGAVKSYFLSEGFFRVYNSGGSLDLLCPYFEDVKEIDIERAKKSKERSLQRVKEDSAELDSERAHKSLTRAEIRLRQAFSLVQ